jgi:hypothetical protein
MLGDVLRQEIRAIFGTKKRSAWNAVRTVLCVSTLVFGTFGYFSAHAQKLSDKWAQISPGEFENFKNVFSAYDIETYRNDIVVLGLTSIKIFRIESKEFCTGTLCLTILVSVCSKPICPSTAIFVRRDVEFVSMIAGYFGGTQFLRFPLSKDRDVTVIVTKRFISVGRGFGEE